VAIFAPDVDYSSQNDALLNLNAGGPGVDETGELTAENSGWYGIVVYKTGFGDLGLDASYTLCVGDRQPNPVTDLTITPVDTDPLDDYLHFDLQFDDVTQDIHGAPLEVDHYELYWNFNAYANFSGWSLAGSNTASEFLNALWYTGVQMYGFFRVVAVDTDGRMIMLPGGETVTDLPQSNGQSIPGIALDPVADPEIQDK
jgi:hypothetical protein